MMDNQTTGQIPVPQNQPTKDENTTTNLELWGRTRLGLLILAVIGLTVWGKTCGKKKVDNNVPGQAVKISHPSSIKIISKGTSTPTKTSNKYIPPEGGITITPKDPTKSIDELIKIHYQEMGFTFEPGIEVSGNLYYSYGLDAKLFYFYRLGLGAGLVGGSNVTTLISPDIFMSYRLDQIHLRNTEAVVTYVPASKIPFGVGLRINL